MQERLNKALVRYPPKVIEEILSSLVVVEPLRCCRQAESEWDGLGKPRPEVRGAQMVYLVCNEHDFLSGEPTNHALKRLRRKRGVGSDRHEAAPRPVIEFQYLSLQVFTPLSPALVSPDRSGTEILKIRCPLVDEMLIGDGDKQRELAV